MHTYKSIGKETNKSVEKLMDYTHVVPEVCSGGISKGQDFKPCVSNATKGGLFGKEVGYESEHFGCVVIIHLLTFLLVFYNLIVL